MMKLSSIKPNILNTIPRQKVMGVDGHVSEFQEIVDSSLTVASNTFKESKCFKNEISFTENLITKLPSVIKSMYGLSVVEIIKEVPLFYDDIGLYRVRIDIALKTKEGVNIYIECKNPTHQKAEMFAAVSQMMANIMLLQKIGEFNNKYILATSAVPFYIWEFIHFWKIKGIDVICNNPKQVAFWNNSVGCTSSVSDILMT